MMNHYLERAGFPVIALCFASLSKLNVIISLRLKVKAICDLKKLVVEAFKDIKPDISPIGTHSLWSGGTNYSCRNCWLAMPSF